MKAIFVKTKNNIFAKNRNDILDWSPKEDKKLFKLLTIINGTIICSKNTYSLLPASLKGDKERNIIIAGREGESALNSLNKKYPDAILIGGPNFINEAIGEGIIDTIIVNILEDVIIEEGQYFDSVDYSNFKEALEIKLWSGIKTKVYKRKE